MIRVADSVSAPRVPPVWLGAIVVVALGLRLVAASLLVGLAGPLDAAANPDQVEYDAIARHLISGHGYSLAPDIPTAARPPGTPFAIILPYLVAGPSVLAARVWFAVLSALACGVTAMVAARAGGATVGVVAGLWLAAYPAQIISAGHLLSEPVFALLLALTLLLAISAFDTVRLSRAVMAGLCLGGAILTRVEFVLVLAPSAVAVWWCRQALGPARVRHAGVIALTAIVVVSPWPIRNALVIGKPLLSTQRGYVWWGAHNDLTFTDPARAGNWVGLRELLDDRHPLVGSETARDAQAMAYGDDAIRRHWRSLPYLIAMKEWRLLSPLAPNANRLARWGMTLGWGIVLPFAMAGCRRAWRTDPSSRRRWAVIAMPFCATLLSAAVFYGLPRFRDAVAPAFIPFAAAGLYGLAARWLPGAGLSRSPSEAASDLS